MTRELTHIDLFAGIGGFKLAAQSAGFTTVAFSEIDPFCIAVYGKHWPQIQNLGDIRTADVTPYRGITLLTAGVCCQPFSIAGRRKGKADHRYLWEPTLNAIKSARPRWIIVENVTNIANMVLSDWQDDLETFDYKSVTFDIPACALGLPTVERHIWLVASDNMLGCEGFAESADANQSPLRIVQELDSRISDRWRESSSRVCGGGKGISARLHALGNAFNPQVAEVICQAIARIERQCE